MKRLALALALLPQVALADNAMLSTMTRQIDAGEGGGLAAAYAACIAGAGDAEATAAFWTDAGWTRSDDTEMGLVTLSSPAASWGVTIAADGSFCEVASERIGTGQAAPLAMAATMMTDMPGQTANTPSGCLAFAVPGGVLEIMSTGQDPVCNSDTTHAARVTFE